MPLSSLFHFVMAEVLILTGPPASGKTTVAVALAERYDRVAHIDVDVVRHFVTPTGFAKPRSPERRHQRLLGARNGSALARNFLADRFGAIIDECFDEPDLLPVYLDELKPANADIHVVTLLPSLEACKARDVERRNAGRGSNAGWIRTDYERFLKFGSELPGSTIDSSDLTVYETADRLQALTTSGECIVWRPA
jgi:chloramphenicol 3-O-phosphotransferase